MPTPNVGVAPPCLPQTDAEDLQAIRNTAYYARPASSSDRSRFAIPKQELFEYQAHVLDG